MSDKPRIALTREDKQRLFAGRAGSGFVTKAQRKKETVLYLAEVQSWKCFWCGQGMTRDDPDAPTYRTLEHVISKASGGLQALQQPARHVEYRRA